MDPYDRQVRLWGAAAQARLEGAHVVAVVGGSAVTSSELLKNLVLPGVGRVTLVDGAAVTPADAAADFFVPAAAVGSPRAAAVGRQLQALNPRVAVAWRDEALPAFLAGAAAEAPFWAGVGLVCGCQLAAAPAAALAAVCRARRCPLLLLRAYGLIGTAALVAEELLVYDARRPNASYDLHLAAPFPELVAHAAAAAPAATKLPYPLLLLHAADAWRASHEHGALPATREDQDAFRALIRGRTDAENAAEAAANAHRLWRNTAGALPLSVFEDARCRNPGPAETDFWHVAHALRRFVCDENGGQLPVCSPGGGAFPDMAAGTAPFVALRGVYEAKATAQHARIGELLAARCHAIGRPCPPRSLVRELCDHCADLALIRPSPPPPSPQSPQSSPNGNGGAPSATAWLLALRACDAFLEAHGRFPGAGAPDDFEADVSRLREIAAASAATANDGLPNTTPSDDVITEVVRFAGTCVPAVAAAVGALGAQEAVKILTHCFVPLNNTAVFDGIHCTTETLSLFYDSH